MIPTLPELHQRRRTVAAAPDVYCAFPDLVRLPSGKLRVIYRESDQHVPGWSELVLMESDDEGETWGARRVLDRKEWDRDGAVWNCPRFGWVAGRLWLVCDTRPDVAGPGQRGPWSDAPNLFLWESDDGGATWSSPRNLGCHGAVPDRPTLLDERSVGISAHCRRSAGGSRVQVLYTSADGGRQWNRLSTVCEAPGYEPSEASLLSLAGGRLLGFMRDSRSGGAPTFLVHSDDGGRSWSAPRALPFWGHRPTAAPLPDGRLLITFRDVHPEGASTTCAWLCTAERPEEGRLLALDERCPHTKGDFGYSGWTALPDGRVLCVYHFRGAAAKPEIRAVSFSLEDFD